MKVVVHWSGGKTVHGASQGGRTGSRGSMPSHVHLHGTFVFHSFKVIEQQAKALGVPHQFVKITDNRYDDIMGTLERLHKEEGVEAIVTGDIDNVHHRRVWKDACRKLDMKLIMPLWDRPLNLIPGSRYRKRIMNLELTTGVKAILSCVDQRYFDEKWLGRAIDEKCVEDLKSLVGPAGKGIDVSGEPGEYHSTALDAPLFKEASKSQNSPNKARLLISGVLPIGRETSSTWTLKKQSLNQKTNAAIA